MGEHKCQTNDMINLVAYYGQVMLDIVRSCDASVRNGIAHALICCETNEINWCYPSSMCNQGGWAKSGLM